MKEEEQLFFLFFFSLLLEHIKTSGEKLWSMIFFSSPNAKYWPTIQLFMQEGVTGVPWGKSVLITVQVPSV